MDIIEEIERVISAIEAGGEVRPAFDSGSPLVLTADFLRSILIGSVLPTRSGPCRLTAAGLIIDGGSWETGPKPLRHIILQPAKGQTCIDLKDLSNADGAALPPLIFRNCQIQGELNLRGSHFASLTLENCTLSRLMADACQIDGECHLVMLRPPRDNDPENINPINASSEYCQVRMVATRIDGSLDLRGSRLIAPRIEPSNRQEVSRTYADRFALSLASSEIAGRVLMTNGFLAVGGVSLFQAEVKNAVRIADAKLEAQFPGDVALDAAELTLGGTLAWISSQGRRSKRKRPDADWDVSGPVLLKRAIIGGDVLINDCVWRKNGPDVEGDAYAHGGVDARFISVAGQLRVTEGSIIARRGAAPSGLETFANVGPAIDCWKGSFGRGVRLLKGAILHGPLLLNGCTIQREIFIACDIRIGRACNNKALYHQALDLSDGRLDGPLILEAERIEGRVTLQRLRVIGAIDIIFLGLIYKGTEYGGNTVSSILDLQDLDIQGGINLRYQAIRATAECAEDHRFVVDLRGMRCDSYDDADGGCWQGLNPQKAGCWRIRFEGIAFDRLDKTVFKDRNGRGDDVVEYDGEQIVKQRYRAFTSFYLNRADYKPTLAARVGRFVRRIKTRPRGRERDLQQFSPQTYETFAKAYLTNGDLDVGVGLIEKRSDIQWQLRVYRFSHYWLRIAALTAFISLLGLVGLSAMAKAMTDLWVWAAAGILLPILFIGPILALALVAFAFKLCFGYGLRPERAITTFFAVWLLGVCGMNLLSFLGHPIPTKPPERHDNPTEQALYVFDFLLPADFGQTANYDLGKNPALQHLAGWYQALGWLVISIGAVTISGVLKRDVER